MPFLMNQTIDLSAFGNWFVVENKHFLMVQIYGSKIGYFVYEMAWNKVGKCWKNKGYNAEFF